MSETKLPEGLSTRSLIRQAPGAGGALPKARIYGKEMLTYQAPGANPQPVEHTFVRYLESDKQIWRLPYAVATSEWVGVETGWLDTASLIRVENLEGHFRQVQPSPQERQAAEGKIIEIGIFWRDEPTPVSEVPPREVLKLFPLHGDPAQYYIRARGGDAHYSLSIYPK